MNPPKRSPSSPTLQETEPTLPALSDPVAWLRTALVELPRVPGYELDEVLGEGGAGTVYLASEVAADRLVAVKLAKTADAELVFREEMRCARKLVHPRIVRALASGRTAEGRGFLVLEYVPGGTLAEAVEAGRCSEPRDVLGLMLEVTRAVQHAHEHAVLHCDLKPENILLDAHDMPRVSDFGVARRLRVGASAEKYSTSEGACLGGTIGWMSPEQTRLVGNSDPEAFSELTVASDIFSLGVLLYWLVARALPFGDGADFIARVQHERPAPCTSARPNWKSWAWEIEAVCQRCMNKQRQNRYSSAAELGDDLQRLLSGLAISAEHPMLARRAAKWVRRRPLAAVAVTLLPLLVLYLLVLPAWLEAGVVRRAFGDAAAFQAGAATNEFRKTEQTLRRVVSDPGVRELVSHPDVTLPAPSLGKHAASGDPTATLMVFDADGHLRARWPTPPVRPDTVDYGFRDYSTGAIAFGHGGIDRPYVSKMIRNTIGGELSLAMILPFWEGQKFAGFLMSPLYAGDRFGEVQMNCRGDLACATMLVALRDRDTSEELSSSQLTVLASPHAPRRACSPPPGELQAEKALEQATTQAICDRFTCKLELGEQFELTTPVDPLLLRYVEPHTEKLMVGAAVPVGKTGVFVIVGAPSGASWRHLLDVAFAAAGTLWVPVGVALLVLGVLRAWLRLPFVCRGPLRG